MSQENVEVVRATVTMFNRSGFLPEKLFDPEIELYAHAARIDRHEFVSITAVVPEYGCDRVEDSIPVPID